jgi:hypothetical protein
MYLCHYIVKLKNYCKYYNKGSQNENESFLSACENSNIKILNFLYKKYKDLPFERGLKMSYNNKSVSDWILSKNILNLDLCLKNACNSYDCGFSEFLVKNGANINVGLRYSNSANITGMLYKYKNISNGF